MSERWIQIISKKTNLLGACNAVTGNALITSVFCLQFPTQNSLSDGMIPVFYHDKIPARTGDVRNAVLLSILQWIEHLMCIILPSDFDKLIQTSFHYLEVKVARFAINFTCSILQKLNPNGTKWNKISSMWLEMFNEPLNMSATFKEQYLLVAILLKHEV